MTMELSSKINGYYVSICERAYYDSNYITNALLDYLVETPFWTIENDFRKTLKMMGKKILSKNYRVQLNHPLLRDYEVSDFINGNLSNRFIDVRLFGKEFMDGKDSVFCIDKKIYLRDGLLRVNKYYQNENNEYHMIIHDGLIVAPISDEDLKTVDEMNTTYISRDFGEKGQEGYFRNRFYLRIEFNAYDYPNLNVQPINSLVDVKRDMKINSEHYMDNVQIDVKELFYYLKNHSKDIETIYIKSNKNLKFIYNNNVLDYDEFIRHIDNQNIKVTVIE